MIHRFDRRVVRSPHDHTVKELAEGLLWVCEYPMCLTIALCVCVIQVTQPSTPEKGGLKTPRR